jgi:hypothetical protein
MTLSVIDLAELNIRFKGRVEMGACPYRDLECLCGGEDCVSYPTATERPETDARGNKFVVRYSAPSVLSDGYFDDSLKDLREISTEALTFTQEEESGEAVSLILEIFRSIWDGVTELTESIKSRMVVIYLKLGEFLPDHFTLQEAVDVIRVG